MTKDYTFGYIKKRILDALLEYVTNDKEYLVTDDTETVFDDRFPYVVSSCLVRMYESLPIGVGECQGDIQKDAEKTFAVLPCDFARLVKITVSGVDTGSATITVSVSEGTNYLAPTDATISVSVAFAPIVTNKAYVSEGRVYFSARVFEEGEKAHITYKKQPPEITKDTSDEYILSLMPLALEALVNLSASELCTAGDSDAYTRLVYKYNDLAEGFFSANDRKVSRNVFYRARERGI